MAVCATFLMSGSAPAYVTKQVRSGGAIVGRVAFSGEAPPPEILQVGQDREVCGQTQAIDEVEVNSGGVKNAVVKIVGIEQGKQFDFPEAILDQKGCVFSPHIVLMPPGKLTVRSSDPALHNVHTTSVKNTPVNVAMPRFKRSFNLLLSAPEIISVKCDVHGWMSAFIIVAEHPYYAVTDDAGHFEVRDVPPGTYTLEVWHGKLGTLRRKVSIEAAKVTEAEVTFTH